MSCWVSVVVSCGCYGLDMMSTDSFVNNWLMMFVFYNSTDAPWNAASANFLMNRVVVNLRFFVDDMFDVVMNCAASALLMGFGKKKLPLGGVRQFSLHGSELVRSARARGLPSGFFHVLVQAFQHELLA